jgi:hypothetical protein
VVTVAELERLRLKVRSLLHFSDAADALYVYYAFYHDPDRTALYVQESDAGRADGFAAVCQTGQRLFQPTVVLRAEKARVAIELLRQALVPGRPYTLITTPGLRDRVTKVVDVERFETNRVYKLDLPRLRPMVNVLVAAEEGVGGRPRFVIRSQEEVAAEAGINWYSPHFAEVFVRATSVARERGWDQAVLMASTTWAIRSARQPVYIAGEGDELAVKLAEETGYVDTGAREFVVEGVYRA